MVVLEHSKNSEIKEVVACGLMDYLGMPVWFPGAIKGLKAPPKPKKAVI